MTPSRHELYYMKDGVSFLVENTLFRVPRYMLENTSPVFSTMLSDVQPDAAPISLPKVTSTDFERLLEFLYPLTPQVDAIAKPWDEQQWTSILRLATMWEMSDVRTVAMRLLSRISNPIVKICLGREYGHQPWVREGFIMLCLRREPLTSTEGIQLSKDDVIACAAAREEIRVHVLSKDQGWRTGAHRHLAWIGANDTGVDSVTYQQFSSNRMVRQIVNHAFGFALDFEDELDLDDGGNENMESKGYGITWRSLQEFTGPRISWLINKHKGESKQFLADIKSPKDLFDSASILTAAEIEKHWICGMLEKDTLVKYATPLSYSALALSLGVLILIPHTIL